MIIDCPHCSTRFSIALNKSSLAEKPQTKLRFNCCRCGKYFTKDLTPVEISRPVAKVEAVVSSVQIKTATPTATIEQASQAPQQQLSFLPAVTVEDLIQDSPKLLSANRLQFDSNVGTATEDELFQGAKATWQTNSAENYSVDMSSVLRKHLGEQAEAKNLKGLRERMMQRYREEQNQKKAAQIEKSSQKQEIIKAESEQVTQAPTSEEKVDQAPLIRRRDSIKRPQTREKLHPKQFKIPFLGKLAAMKKESAQIGPISLFCSLPLTVGIVLWGISGNLASPDTILSKAISSVYSAPLKVPPQGAELEQVKAEFKTLDDGSLILQINGRIENKSNYPLHDLRLRVDIFDKDNNLRQQEVILNDNSLMGASKINSMNARTIKELQSRRQKEMRPIAAGASSPFRAIITDVPLSAVWASANIYAVRIKS